MIPSCSLIQADCIDGLRMIRDDSIHCVVTSPPYWRMRDYGFVGQLGLETTFGEYLNRMVGVFREVRRVLRPDGVLWLNMGDSFATASSGSAHRGLKAACDLHSPRKNPRLNHRYADRPVSPRRKVAAGFVDGELIGQAWRLALALVDDGWVLRQDVIWHKPSAMPESAKRRLTRCHEYIFVLVRGQGYAWNAAAAKEPVSGNAHPRGAGTNPKSRFPQGWSASPGRHSAIDHSASKAAGRAIRPRQNESFSAAVSKLVDQRNMRTVWTIASRGYKGAHFATFPESLAHRCISIGSQIGDTVLDPFGGSGTTGKVAVSLGRRAVLIEASPSYCDLARDRLRPAEAKPHLPADLAIHPFERGLLPEICAKAGTPTLLQ